MRTQDQYGDVVSTDDLCPIPTRASLTEAEIDLVAAAQWYTIDALPGSVFVRRSELGHAIELEDPFGDLGEFIETGAKLLLIAEPLKRGNQVDGFYHA